MGTMESIVLAFATFFVISYIVVHIGGVVHPRNQNMTTVMIMTFSIPAILILFLGLVGLIA